MADKLILTDEEIGKIYEECFDKSTKEMTFGMEVLSEEVSLATVKKVVEYIETQFEDVTGKGSVEQILAIPKYKWQALKATVEKEVKDD